MDLKNSAEEHAKNLRKSGRMKKLCKMKSIKVFYGKERYSIFSLSDGYIAPFMASVLAFLVKVVSI